MANRRVELPMTRVLRAAEPIGLFLLALAVRLVSWHSIFQSDGVYPNGNDAYYHLRRIRYSVENFPSILSFDPLINFPDGAQPIWSPPFDWLIAALILALPGFDGPDRIAAIAVWIPPIIGAGTVVIVYLVALRFYSRRVAIFAASALAVLPAHSFYSRLGAIDHHAAVAPITFGMLAVAMRLFRNPPPGERNDSDLFSCLWLGLMMAAAVLIWPGTLIHVGILQLAMVGRLLVARDREHAIVWARQCSIVHLTTCVFVFPLSAGNEWSLWGSFSPVVLSDFQPTYFFAASISFGSLGFLWKRGWASSSALSRASSSSLVGTIVIGVLLLAIPDLSSGLEDALSWLTKDEEFQAVVNESGPLLAGPSGIRRAVLFLSGFVFFTPLSIAYLVWRFRDRPDQLLLIGWTAAFSLATLLQWRFMNTLSIAYCLLFALVASEVHRAVAPHLNNSFRTWTAGIVTASVVALAFAAPIQGYGAHFESIMRGVRGQSTPPVGTVLQATHIAAAARFLRAYAPPVEPAAYSVLGPWGDGHIIKYIAELPVVQDNFGDDVSPRNFELAERYFATRDESEALRVIAPIKARYVLVRSSGSGHSKGYTYDSLFTRLYHLQGNAGRPVGRGGRRFPAMPSLEHHRLIYRSAPLDARARLPYCTLFEIVRGAVVAGRAEPDTLVTASLVIQPSLGDRFEYVAETLADEAGEYTLRLPYSNEAASPDVRTAPRYIIRAMDRSEAVFVPETAVREGHSITGPSFIDPTTTPST